MINEKDCFEKGLLKRMRKQPDLAVKDLNQAKFFLKEAQEILDMGKKQLTVMALYNAYFHTARALLFNDGIKERSHYCIARYIESNYELEESLDLFETTMNLRHNVQYSTDPVEVTEDLNELISGCEKFISEVRSLL